MAFLWKIDHMPCNVLLGFCATYWVHILDVWFHWIDSINNVMGKNEEKHPHPRGRKSMNRPNSEHFIDRKIYNAIHTAHREGDPCRGSRPQQRGQENITMPRVTKKMYVQRFLERKKCNCNDICNLLSNQSLIWSISDKYFW